MHSPNRNDQYTKLLFDRSPCQVKGGAQATSLPDSKYLACRDRASTRPGKDVTALPPVPPQTPLGLPHATSYRVPAPMLSPATGATRAAIVSRETGWSVAPYVGPPAHPASRTSSESWVLAPPWLML